MKTELEKIQEVREKSQAIGTFLEWLSYHKNYIIAQYSDEEEDDEELVPVHANTEALIAEFFEINLVKAEEERREILEKIREK